MQKDFVFWLLMIFLLVEFFRSRGDGEVWVLLDLKRIKKEAKKLKDQRL